MAEKGRGEGEAGWEWGERRGTAVHTVIHTRHHAVGGPGGGRLFGRTAGGGPMLDRCSRAVMVNTQSDSGLPRPALPSAPRPALPDQRSLTSAP